MKYEYDHLEELFTPSTWEADVSPAWSTCLMQCPVQFEDSFGLHSPPGDWSAFNTRITGRSLHRPMRVHTHTSQSERAMSSAAHDQGRLRSSTR